MAIEIKHGAPGILLGLAQAAGAGLRRDRNAELDLAFMNMSLAAQARNAEIAGRMQAQDRAFALQAAAASRTSRTSTSAARTTDPAFNRMLWKQSQESLEQQDQIAQLRAMRATGKITQKQLEMGELGISRGESIMGILDPKPVRPAKPAVSVANEIQLNKLRWDRRHDLVNHEIKQLRTELATEYNIRDESGEVVPELEAQLKKKTDERQVRLNALRMHQQNLIEGQNREAEAIENRQRAPQPTGQDLVAGPTGTARPETELDIPIPLSSEGTINSIQATLVVGQLYEAPNGKIHRWNGQQMIPE